LWGGRGIWVWGEVGGVSGVPVFHEDLGEGAAAAGLVEVVGGDVGAGCEGAEDGVEDDVFDVGGGLGLLGGGEFGEGEGGDLEAVEEQAGAARVEGVGGDAGEDFAEGEADGGVVFEDREVEGGAAGAAPARVGEGLAGGVVVVAEFFGAEAGGLAAAALGQDVAALEAEWFCGGHWWGPPPPVCCTCSSKETT
jgi:hypothetical protein